MNTLLFRNKIRKLVEPYYLLNDSAHHIDHADDVCKLGLKLNSSLVIEKQISPYLIILAAYFHDIAAKHRDTHELEAADIVRTLDVDYLNELSSSDREKVALACSEHRASYKGEFSSILSEIISSADRGEPSLTYHLERSIQFNIERKGYTYDKAVAHAKKHMKEKYGRSGYAKYPEIYLAFYNNEITSLQNAIDTL